MFSRLIRLLATALIALAFTVMPASAQVASWVVKDRSLSAPPGSPVNGDRYIVGASPTGAWAGHANDIAVRSDSQWKFITAQAGLSAWVADEPAKIIYFNGTSWGDLPTSVNVNPSIPVTLLGNGAAGIVSSLVSNGETTSHAGPQFQAVFGLASKHGVGLGSSGNNVALYSGIETWNGSGNTWGANILNRLMPGLDASVQTYQISELDLQNDARDFGIGEVIGPGAASIGLSITASTQLSLNGGNAYRNNAAIWLTGRTNSWTNGIVFSAPAFVNAAIYESVQVASTFGLYLAGTHTWGIDFSGGTISSAAVRCKNNMPCMAAVNAAGSGTVVFSRLDASDRLIIGEGVTTTRLNSSQFEFSSSVMKISGTQVVAARDTGWTAMTGTPNKATVYDTSSITLPQLAGRVMVLQAALTTHGLIGP